MDSALTSVLLDVEMASGCDGATERVYEPLRRRDRGRKGLCKGLGEEDEAKALRRGE